MAVSPTTIKQELAGTKVNTVPAAPAAPAATTDNMQQVVDAGQTNDKQSVPAVSVPTKSEQAIIRLIRVGGETSSFVVAIDAHNPPQFVRFGNTMYVYAYSQFPLASGAAPVTVVYNEVPLHSILEL